MLTDSERGDLKLHEFSERQLNYLPAFENPGYLKPEFLYEIIDIDDFPQANSVYFAVYSSGPLYNLQIMTSTFNSEDMDAALKGFYLRSLKDRDDPSKILIKENTIVLVSSDFNHVPIEDISNKLSQRLGLEFFETSQLPEFCYFHSSDDLIKPGFRCVNYSMTGGGINLTLRSEERDPIVIESIDMSSIGQTCTTRRTYKPVPSGPQTRITSKIDKPVSGGSEIIIDLVCDYDFLYKDYGREKNQYEIKL